MAATVTIPSAFRGPPASGQGGYSCALFARHAGEVAEASLRRPVPLDRPLTISRLGERVEVHDDGELVAEAWPSEVGLAVPDPVAFERAEVAAKAYPALESAHELVCFVCAPRVPPDAGLHVYPSPVPGEDVVAAPWIPSETLLAAGTEAVPPSFVWAVLDCTGSWGAITRYGFNAAPLLRQVTKIDRLPRLGERTVCVGWVIERDGRKARCGAALYSDDGEVLATSRLLTLEAKSLG